jgi:hypothetical protein
MYFYNCAVWRRVEPSSRKLSARGQVFLSCNGTETGLRVGVFRDYSAIATIVAMVD